ncbi:MAG: hypothetical protein Q8P20_09935 [bacterium]|nr:hypothetical protein [bacterium]
MTKKTQNKKRKVISLVSDMDIQLRKRNRQMTAKLYWKFCDSTYDDIVDLEGLIDDQMMDFIHGQKIA